MIKYIRKFVLFTLVFGVAVLVGGLAILLVGLPDIDNLKADLLPASIRITDRDGRLLYEVLPTGTGRQTNLPFSAFPKTLVQATIATEDREFYQHPGVNFIGIVRAFWINLRGGEILAGGSTITQQAARTILLSDKERLERTYWRKLREIVLALQLDQRYSKEEILALYLNQTYYGGLAYGAEAASQTFFGKPARELDLAESALLAGLPQAPALYNPLIHPEAAKERQLVVLDLMEKSGMINAEQKGLASREVLVYADTPYPIEAPHFVMMVRAQLDEILPPDQRATGQPLIVHTTLDLDFQHLAENAVIRQLSNLQEHPKNEVGHNVNNAALVALNPQSGEILAMVGSPDYFDTSISGSINMALAPRQPGSALKPFVYAAAFDPEQSNPWTAATMLLDVETHFQTQEGKAFTPKNYDGLEHGPVLAREALGSSLNIPAVLTLEHIGLDTLVSLLKKLGVTTLVDPNRYDLSLALGGGEIRLLELTAAYGALANGGNRLTPFSILDITTGEGETLFSNQPPALMQVIDPRVAWLITNILSDDDARLIGFSANSALKIDRPAAVKTGTTTNFHDNWTIGYTPEIVVGVWVGNSNYEPMKDITGLTGAAPIWHQFIRSVLTGQPKTSFPNPEGLVQETICAQSGQLPTQACLYKRSEWFIKGTVPTEQDTMHRMVTIDSRTGFQANPDTPAEQRRNVIALDLPPQANFWAHNNHILLFSELVQNQPTNGIGSEHLRIAYPGNGTIYQLSKSLPPESQRIRIAAISSVSLASLSIWVDGENLIVLSSTPYETWWNMTPGVHETWAEGTTVNDERLLSERIRFEVLAP